MNPENQINSPVPTVHDQVKPVNSTPESTRNNPIPTFSETIRSGWKFFLSHWKKAVSTTIIGGLFVLISYIFVFGGISLIYAGSASKTGIGMAMMGGGGIIALIGVILGIYSMYIFYVRIKWDVVLLDRGESPSLKTIFKPEWSGLWSAVWVSLLFVVIPYAGYPLLIIPGIMIFLMSAFCYNALFVDGRKGLSAFVLSAWTVKGYKWGLLGRLIGIVGILLLSILFLAVISALVVLLLTALLSLVGLSSAMFFVLVPIGIIYLVFWISAVIYIITKSLLDYYKALRKVRGEVSPEYTQKMHKWFKVFAIFGAIVYLGFNGMSMFTDAKNMHEQKLEQQNKMINNMHPYGEVTPWGTQESIIEETSPWSDETTHSY